MPFCSGSSTSSIADAGHTEVYPSCLFHLAKSAGWWSSLLQRLNDLMGMAIWSTVTAISRTRPRALQNANKTRPAGTYRFLTRFFFTPGGRPAMIRAFEFSWSAAAQPNTRRCVPLTFSKPVIVVKNLLRLVQVPFGALYAHGTPKSSPHIVAWLLLRRHRRHGELFQLCVDCGLLWMVWFIDARLWFFDFVLAFFAVAKFTSEWPSSAHSNNIHAGSAPSGF
jgi:hypothetical protein